MQHRWHCACYTLMKKRRGGSKLCCDGCSGCDLIKFVDELSCCIQLLTLLIFFLVGVDLLH